MTDATSSAEETVKKETEEFLTKLEVEAEAVKRNYMEAHVPMAMQKAFLEKFPPPAPPATPPATPAA